MLLINFAESMSGDINVVKCRKKWGSRTRTGKYGPIAVGTFYLICPLEDNSSVPNGPQMVPKQKDSSRRYPSTYLSF